jgi:hypothetical protein
MYVWSVSQKIKQDDISFETNTNTKVTKRMFLFSIVNDAEKEVTHKT